MSLQWSHLLNYINEIPQLISLCINFEGRLHYSVKYILQLLRIYWKTCILDLCNFLLIQRQRIKQKTTTTTTTKKYFEKIENFTGSCTQLGEEETYIEETVH